MAFVIGGLLALFVIAVVGYPIYTRRSRPQASPGQRAGRIPVVEALTTGHRPHEQVYEDMSTLRLDYELGRVDEEGYQRRLREYRLEAAASLKHQDGLEQQMDRSLEEEILAARARRADGQHTGIDETVEGETDGPPSS